MIHYILQVLFFQLLFLLVYDLFLKKETFFNYNRLYLLVTPLLAFIIPWLRLEFLVEAVPDSARLVIPKALINEPDVYTQQLPLLIINAEGGWTPNWWLITYLGGLLVSLGFFAFRFLHLKKLAQIGNQSYENGLRIIIVPGSKLAYTFFNSIYLGEDLDENEKKQILSHELVHVKQKHSYDLLFFEMLKILFWFNPLVYIYQSRIAGVHEFIADSEAVKTFTKKTYFEQLLNTAFNTKDISFTNQFFNQSLIKKRIVMLQKHKSSRLSTFKFLLLIPAMLFMLTYVACSENKNPDIVEEEMSLTDKISDLEATLESKENLTEEERQQLIGLIHKGFQPEKPPTDQKRSVEVETEAVPFAVLDKAPAFKSCEQLDISERKKCTTKEISNFVSANFNTGLGKEFGLTGINRIVVRFMIDKSGNVKDIKARAPLPQLEEEAERVISQLPQFNPGEVNGKPVNVMYSLPIAFKTE
ncbi:M56 family metallopeptidase [Gramella jeungdoensis]|uniref:M56 family metallopeptidase n=1 Tax=Gramella jeungdoensis TaxID=708091 RepID=A0ABT0YZV1_9FLAO|nr:M56 family metallopeptidase [Gramella jeungdoensis]MCM8568675.1 M56 family metallopeptidase [Gramella jeungdoensis]